ncbi:unnamed protein product [Diatraea saccharalis]|uniref:Transposable element P transposase-like GTP-binding insertion domain-containing protein n=1 Tax=Diatraea saccharalis TaxID=40085 RepID=A0A9N9WE04_9NEOP|nr:unnamed protein product [Diatraea saccharalis]CAG9789152.1 unnamed protein product [Diatraea saccharalis]
MPRLCSFGRHLVMSLCTHSQNLKFPERFKAWVTLVGGKLETEGKSSRGILEELPVAPNEENSQLSRSSGLFPTMTEESLYSSKYGNQSHDKLQSSQMSSSDKCYGELRLLNKLTEEHIDPEKNNKMRVKLATQVFSHSIAVVAEHLTARGDLQEECRQLVNITLLIDDLFDSLNINTLNIPNGKIYKESVIPSSKNFIKTIENMEAIWKVLYQNYRLDCLLTNNLNQDPIENFFGNIRS